jgi:methylphosphotriester-DNA--protein-cysteine methyltransferase
MLILSSFNSESESLLLTAAKQKICEAETEIKPLTSLSQKRLNPFKKSVAKVEGSRGLANLDASFAQQKSNKNKHNSIPEQPPPQQTKVHNHHFL